MSDGLLPYANEKSVAEPPKSGEGVASAVSVVETLDYYPYGGIRLDNTAGGYSGDKRKYIGQQYDAATQLSYLNSRYYNGMQGQFLSQDPGFLAMGNSNKVQQLTNQNQMALLANPQELNAYSYSQDNPITKSDPSGNWYIDLNATFVVPIPYFPVVGVGITGGFLISQNGLYDYAGPAGGTPVPSLSGGFSTANPSVGGSASASGCFFLCYGRSLDGSSEWSVGTPGYTLSTVYTAQIPIQSLFGSATYNVYPSQSQTNQSLQNANPINGNKSQQSLVTTNSASHTGSSYGSASGGGSLGSQQLQNIQSEINTIQSEIQTIQREINAL